MPQDPKKPKALVIAPDGRQIDVAAMQQRLQTPGVGTPGMSATLPGNTLDVVPDAPVGSMPSVGSALMNANVGAQPQVTIPPMSPADPSDRSALFDIDGQNAAAFQQSRQAMAGAAAKDGLAAGEFAGRQSGTLEVKPDSPLAGGFGVGNKVPVGAYSRILNDEGAQRQADISRKHQTRLGGMGGTPGGGGKSIITTTRPRYAGVESKVNGKMVTLPQPVYDRLSQITQTINTAVSDATTRAQSLPPGGGPQAPDLVVQRKGAEARKQARKALSPEDKAFLAAVESGAGPEAFGLKVANRGRRTRTGKKLPDTFTTSAPHPLSDAAGKPKAAPTAPKLSGNTRRNFQLTDKSLSSTSKIATVERHIRDFYKLPPAHQKIIAQDNPQLGTYAAWIDRGYSHEVAQYEAYKVKPVKGEKPIGTEGAAFGIADRYLYGDEIMEKVEVETADGKKWVTRGTGRFRTAPWHRDAKGNDIGDKSADRRKAMRAAYDKVNEDLSNRGWTDEQIVRFFNAAVHSPTETKEAVSPEDKALWLDIKEKDLGAPVSVGDMTAEAIEERQAAKEQAKIIIGENSEEISGRSQAKTGGAEGIIASLRDGSVKLDQNNAKAIVDALKAGTITKEQAMQIRHIVPTAQKPATPPVAQTPFPGFQQGTPQNTQGSQQPARSAVDPAIEQASARAARAQEQVLRFATDTGKTSEDVTNEINRLAPIVSDDPAVQQEFRAEATNAAIKALQEVAKKDIAVKFARLHAWVKTFAVDPTHTFKDVTNEIDMLAGVVSDDPEEQERFKAEARNVAIQALQEASRK